MNTPHPAPAPVSVPSVYDTPAPAPVSVPSVYDTPAPAPVSVPSAYDTPAPASWDAPAPSEIPPGMTYIPIPAAHLATAQPPAPVETAETASIPRPPVPPVNPAALTIAEYNYVTKGCGATPFAIMEAGILEHKAGMEMVAHLAVIAHRRAGQLSYTLDDAHQLDQVAALGYLARPEADSQGEGVSA